MLVKKEVWLKGDDLTNVPFKGGMYGAQISSPRVNGRNRGSGKTHTAQPRQTTGGAPDAVQGLVLPLQGRRGGPRPAGVGISPPPPNCVGSRSLSGSNGSYLARWQLKTLNFDAMKNFNVIMI